MKLSILFQLLTISTLSVLISSKHIDSLERNGRIGNSSEPTLILRQVTSDPSSVQIVSELADSEEVTSSSLQNNDLGDSSAESTGSKPVTEKPILADSAAVVDNAVDTPVNQNDPNPINKYCSCSSATCKCCRDFAVPIIPIRGPGCATIRYLDNDKMSISIKYGDFVLASRQIDGRKATPICVPLPGGFNRFCGRVYGVSRKDENFRACLGLELRADDDVEASLRVSCFEFGPRGLATVEADPLPALDEESSEEDDDDDDDILGIGGDDDDDDDDDDDEGAGGGIIGDVLGGALGGGGDDDDLDDGFSFFRSAGNLINGFFGTETNDKKKPNESIKIKRKTKKQTESISRIDTNVNDTTTIDLSKEKTSKPETKEKKKSKKQPKGILDELEAALEEYDDEIEQISAEQKSSNKKVSSVQTAVDGAVIKESNIKNDKDIDEIGNGPDKDDDDDSDEEADDDDDSDEEDDDDDDDDDEDEDEDEYNENTSNNLKSVSSPTEKPVKKKKVKSSYGLGYFGRLLSYFN